MSLSRRPGRKWSQLRLAQRGPDCVWELFHENSKTSRYQGFLPSEQIRAKMRQLSESLAYDCLPHIPLPDEIIEPRLSLTEAMLGRETARAMMPERISLPMVATILRCAYGVNRDNADTIFPRPFRTVPSGGALYPLEIYLHTAHVDGLEAGLYHYSPAANRLALLRRGDLSRQICQALVQSNLVLDSSVLVMITALFERSTFKYGNRGYRFTLLEAGHVAQNVNLICHGLGLGATNIGGYFDRQIDEVLGIDGLSHSAIYLLGIGRPAEAHAGAPATWE